MKHEEAQLRLDQYEQTCSGIQAWVSNVICRDFTKRQLKILGLLHLFQMYNKKMECYIPTLSTFEITGVSRHKIRAEIEKLEELNVISWNRDTNVFTLNSCPNSWKVEFVETYNPNKIQTLMDLNNDQIGSC